ncbi:replication initiation protein [Pseudomonas sp. TNT3]|uniref:replication initiation protein n=1 Tax=Pseudomonas sp. TNT3 TaxID=2654097 RepID=UPI00139175DF|nr:replication initiation protein [Pseudomonas sp. TNT3]KAI2693093.1 replication initiation protein [Pseudomonas sp. TNT3]
MQALSAAELFQKRLTRRPYCSNDLSIEGLYRLPLSYALSRKLIQPNGTNLISNLVFDIDRLGGALDWSDRNAPPPNMTVMNPVNGHAHLIYLLAAPVPVSDAARVKPARYLAAIQEGLRRALDADKGYSGLIVKNPAHQHWATRQWADAPYQLDDLTDYIDLPSPAAMRRRSKQVNYAGLGRNCTVFEIVRKQAYSAVRDYWRPGGATAFAASILNLVLVANHTDIGNPMQERECRAIARSISTWTWRRFTPSEFRTVQSARGKQKGAATRAQLLPKAKAMAAEGRSLREIGRTLGVHHQTIKSWINLGG